MKIGTFNVRIFKIKKRKGYAALCKDCITEGTTKKQAYDRMVKAIRRITQKFKGALKGSKKKPNITSILVIQHIVEVIQRGLGMDNLGHTRTIFELFLVVMCSFNNLRNS